MSENYPDDDDVSFFGTVKAVTESIAEGFGKEHDDATTIGTFVGSLASMIRAARRS
jgi:hypothetical protein